MEEAGEDVGEGDGADRPQQRRDVEKVVLQEHGEAGSEEDQRRAE